MSYAVQDDIELRYPGALEQAGPRNTAGELDEDAIGLALTHADSTIEAYLSGRFPLPWMAPYQSWLIDIAVDLAIYRATPFILVETFPDRKTRHDAALRQLEGYASGKLSPPSDPGILAPDSQETVWFSYGERQFSRGSL